MLPDDAFAVLNAVYVKKMATADTTAEITGLPAERVEERLAAAGDAGWTLALPNGAMLLEGGTGRGARDLPRSLCRGPDGDRGDGLVRGLRDDQHNPRNALGQQLGALLQRLAADVRGGARLGVECGDGASPGLVEELYRHGLRSFSVPAAGLAAARLALGHFALKEN